LSLVFLAASQAFSRELGGRSSVRGSTIIQRSSVPTDGGIDELERLMGATAGADIVDNVVQQRDGSFQPQSTQQLARAGNFKFRLDHRCLQSVYNEWYGLGEFDDGEGGIAGRDQNLGRQWRKGKIHYKKYSRLKQVVESVDKLALGRGITPQVALDQLDPLFKQAKGSLSVMVNLLEINGYRTKGNSRKRRRDEGHRGQDLPIAEP
jgi:hypothetical protein